MNDTKRIIIDSGYGYVYSTYFDSDETRPMKVEIEVRKFCLWWKL